jgi:hypothetical protein
MNLASQANDCQGCIFPLYYCYEGDESPLPSAGASNRVLLEASSVQGAGITCVGPQSLRLGTETSTWSLGGTSSAAVTPTQTISLMHYIAAPGAPVTVALSHNGALGVNWRTYAGDSKHPDLGVPIDGPVAVQKNKTSFFWLISDPVPTSGVSGSQSLIVTATSVISPTDLRWRGDVIWVGSWEAPPPSGYDMYLPAVLR